MALITRVPRPEPWATPSPAQPTPSFSTIRRSIAGLGLLSGASSKPQRGEYDHQQDHGTGQEIAEGPPGEN